MNRVLIKGTSLASVGRRELSRAMGLPQIRRTRSIYVPRESDILINWGNSKEHYYNIPQWINHPSAVQLACDKIATYIALAREGIPTVDYTMDRSRAAEWLKEDERVMHRALTRGSGGRGITMHTSADTFPDGGFFCRMFGDDSNKEYRVHVVGGEIIDATQKRRRSRKNGYEGNFDSTIRSASNGWVFCREDINCPESAYCAAIAAVRALALDFGAVDIGVSGAGVCVYEVNTAPGIEGSTIGRYHVALDAVVAGRRSGVGTGPSAGRHANDRAVPRDDSDRESAGLRRDSVARHARPAASASGDSR